jgi:hypothetical protein
MMTMHIPSQVVRVVLWVGSVSLCLNSLSTFQTVLVGTLSATILPSRPRFHNSGLRYNPPPNAEGRFIHAMSFLDTKTGQKGELKYDAHPKENTVILANVPEVLGATCFNESLELVVSSITPSLLAKFAVGSYINGKSSSFE